MGRGGLGGRESDFRSKGPGFETTYCRFRNFVHHTLPVSFGTNSKSLGHFYQVSMPEEVKDPTHGENV